MINHNFGITQEMVDFALNCQLEDPSDDEAHGFYVGVNWTLYMVKKMIAEQQAKEDHK